MMINVNHVFKLGHFAEKKVTKTSWDISRGG